MENMDEKKLTDIELPVGFLDYMCRVLQFNCFNRHVSIIYIQRN